ncbi:phosphatase PAP2 family protein [Kribbella sp.]|uniref:phosphatase PAP2 family protein n=1 Tax=Kribbella sp. TaxID=1871183 RepID=UPI002D4C0634|nr:phosphatase PAP2 family protein [Kribbella sp.]HZX09126.1 phosphatase PAP2 family protein [Kribbella sp.]
MPLVRRTAVGLLFTVLGSIAFAVQADAAREGDGLAAFDPRLTADFVAHRTNLLSVLARAITFVGEVPVLSLLTVVVAAVIRLRTHRWRPAVVLAAGMAGAAILTYVLKVLIGRQRPDASMVLGTVNNGFSFPSGHSLSGTVFFLLLAGLLWYTSVSLALKIAGTAVAVVLSVAMGLSRVYLGYHWATDVLAGWTVALTWLCLFATVVHLLSSSRVDRAGSRGREGSTP